MALIFIDGKVLTNVPANNFRPIYYLGCKKSFSTAIIRAINEVDPTNGNLCDLFAGTGAIAAAMGQTRTVTTIDIQEYSRVLCSAVLSPAAFSSRETREILNSHNFKEHEKELFSALEPALLYEQKCISDALAGAPEGLAELLEAPPLTVRASGDKGFPDSHLSSVMDRTLANMWSSGLQDSPDTTVSRYFGGVYFSFTQAVQLDCLLAAASSMPEENRKNTLTAAVLSTASTLVNTVGKQFAQPLRPRNKFGAVKSNLANVVQKDRLISATESFSLWLERYSGLTPAIGNPMTLRKDFLEALTDKNQTYSVIYADPPYTRDHYSRFYHVLETMCLRDNPAVSEVTIGGKTMASRGIYREGRHQSPFCIRSAAPEAFESLFKHTSQRDVPLVLSYSPHETGDGTHPRVVSTKQIEDLANEYFDRVEIVAIDGSSHNLLNSNELKLKAREHAELIFKCYS